MQFPEWADLGKTSNQTQSLWQSYLTNLEQYNRYFSGDIFSEKVPVDVGIDEEAPLIYPVGLNLVKMLCMAQSDAAFGEWKQKIVNFANNDDKPMSSAVQKAVDLVGNIGQASNFNSLFWEMELDRNRYGGVAIEIAPFLHEDYRIKWLKIPAGSFYPIWDPEDPDELLEAYVITEMTAEQAKSKYGITSSADFIVKERHWTKSTYETKIDGKRVSAYSGANPWGIIPFVYIPRFRTDNWFGDALTKDLIKVQDEINMRVADIGEAINYNSHPTRWGINLPRKFTTENFPLAPNAMWDMGRSLGTTTPQVGLLEAKNPVPEASFKFVDFLYDWSRTSSFAPPIAFGEDDGGGQRSGVTLEIRMWPLIKSVRRSRSYLSDGIRKAISISGRILQQKDFRDIDVTPLKEMIKGNIVPIFADVMPRDHQAVVDEVVKLSSTTPKSISLETAQEILGRDAGEVERIKEELEDETLHPAPEPFGNPIDPNSEADATVKKTKADDKPDDEKDSVNFKQ